jgi:hypothetical protein
MRAPRRRGSADADGVRSGARREGGRREEAQGKCQACGDRSSAKKTISTLMEVQIVCHVASMYLTSFMTCVSQRHHRRRTKTATRQSLHGFDGILRAAAHQIRSRL